ncbi:baseplate J/gp47 family protein [Paenibacillus sp. FJAT-26967]|uniref:baseplate assembly protein n=1 Tax=Paenibacillus sp. FJAT-26967 TaxID=1729690 RepID=UPI0008381F49|nr:baseplate J/gp47 family protein [Paenibacillus sp. FJAT-26967]
MSLYDLPDLKFVDDDPTATVNNIIAMYEALTESQLMPGDPRRLFLNTLGNIIVQQRVLINQTAKQNYLRYASRPVLQHMGAMVGVTDLPAAAARTTIKITLSTPLTSATIIPAGTRIGPQGGGGSLFFTTQEVAEIKSAQVSTTVTALCSLPGIAGNGFLPGQLNVLIDPLPFVQAVTNLTESAGGAEAESDDSFRERIRAAPESFSTAGPEGAYEFWAKSASSAIIDVGVDSPLEGRVTVIPLLAGGELPTQEVLDAVKEAVNDRRVRPLTDHVTVVEPETVSYNIELTYWVSQSRAADSSHIQTAVMNAVDDYRVWQKSKLGRDINPSVLISRVMAAGALRVNVVSPTYTELTTLKVAQDAQVSVTYGGLSDD